jgi:histidinol-phosphate aminotransferase
MFELRSLLRPHLLTLTPYSSARDEYTGTEGVFLDANENPLGSVTDASTPPVNRYPDPYQSAIKHKLAPIKGVRPGQIFLGNGSDEAIDLLVRAFCVPGQDNVVILPPTYGMYEVAANVNDVAVRKVPLTPDYQLDAEAVLAAADARTKLIWLCSPNNPTGNVLDRAALRRVVEQAPGLVVVDEAYIDFAPDTTLLPELDRYPNLVVIQTFSKAWGLAGLRVGMAFGSEELIGVLNKIKPPYNLNLLTQQYVLKALDHVTKKDEYVAELTRNREVLAGELRELPMVEAVFPSDSNQLLVRFDDAAAVFAYLLSNKIIVRDRSKVTLCERSLRISVGTQSENAELLAALRAFVPHSLAP